MTAKNKNTGTSTTEKRKALRKSRFAMSVQTLLSVLLSGMVVFSLFAETGSQALLEKADSYWKKRHKKADALQGMKILKQIMQNIPNNFSANWRYCRACQYYGRFYLKTEEAKLALYRKGIEAGKRATKTAPGRVEGHFYLGTLYGLYADIKGGVNALSYVKRFKKEIEAAARINPLYENGGPLNTLGMMYIKAPGWPLSFGDDEKGLKLLRRSYRQARANKVINRLLAEVLYDEFDKKAEPLRLIRAALKMPDRPHFVREDREIRAELRKLQTSILADN